MTPTPHALRPTEDAAITAVKTTDSDAKMDKPKSVTITFDPKDAALYAKIVKDAENDDRSPAKLLLIHLRNNYKVS